MTAPSEQEWRKAARRIALSFLGEASESVIDALLRELAPLIERERGEARQEALTEVRDAWLDTKNDRAWFAFVTTAAAGGVS